VQRQSCREQFVQRPSGEGLGNREGKVEALRRPGGWLPVDRFVDSLRGKELGGNGV
jgi:hypothetical protein